jgi:hypothetical protein
MMMFMEFFPLFGTAETNSFGGGLNLRRATGRLVPA